MMNSNQTLALTPIGFVTNEIVEEQDADWCKVVSHIELAPEFASGLRGLDTFSHVLVITYLHRAQFDPAKHLARRPRDLATMPLTGIFAQRAKHRPNPIGITTVRVIGVENNALIVQGLDAINGTPVLDLKPYFPIYDRVPEATVPEWVDRLMAGYF
jgi:tRNA (adenine37-N6)-methyltransferase